MPPRFYVPDLDPSLGVADLPLDEIRHLRNVLRLGVGDDIAVFDGRGHEFHARVESATPRGVRVALRGAARSAPELRVPIALAQAVLKTDRMDDVVRDATMMGAAAIVPLVTTRTIVPARGARASADRWHRVAIASAKQCGRSVVPAVSEPRRLSEWIAGDRSHLKLVLIEPSAADGNRPLSTLQSLAVPASASLLVGPEGGWTPDEIAGATQAGCLAVTLGRRTLRADVIPVAILSILGFLWGDAAPPSSSSDG